MADSAPGSQSTLLYFHPTSQLPAGILNQIHTTIKLVPSHPNTLIYMSCLFQTVSPQYPSVGYIMYVHMFFRSE
jgi:hypothetical protein